MSLHIFLICNYFIHYSIFKLQVVTGFQFPASGQAFALGDCFPAASYYSPSNFGGHKWTRTIDLPLIRRTL